MKGKLEGSNGGKEGKVQSLESFLFGNSPPLLATNVDEYPAENEHMEDAHEYVQSDSDHLVDNLIYEDRTGNQRILVDDYEHSRGVKASKKRTSEVHLASVWEDRHDREVEVDGATKIKRFRKDKEQTVMVGVDYEAALRRQYKAINPQSSWAQKLSETNAREDDRAHGEVLDLVTTAGGLLSDTPPRLPPQMLEVTRMKDANLQEPSTAVIKSLMFHPTAPVLLTGAMDHTVKLFHIDGVKNYKLQSILLEDMRVQQAAFVSGGSQVLATGGRSHCYLHDVESGRVLRVVGHPGSGQKVLSRFITTPSPSSEMAAFIGERGDIPLLSLRSRQWVGKLKMSGSVMAGSFSDDGQLLLTSGGDGIMYVWDLRTRRCLDQVVDGGAYKVSALALAPGGHYCATGDLSGVVNVYSGSGFNTGLVDGDGSTGVRHLGNTLMTPTRHQPLRSLLNLTTTIDSLAFNHDSQVLAMASSRKKDSLRLVHLPSCTVFSNWPTTTTPLHHVSSLAFSPKSCYIAVGNAQGRVLLYRLNHYHSEA